MLNENYLVYYSSLPSSIYTIIFTSLSAQQSKVPHKIGPTCISGYTCKT